MSGQGLERLPVRRAETGSDASQVVIFTTERNECQRAEAMLNDPALTPNALYRLLKNIVKRELVWALKSLRKKRPVQKPGEPESEETRQWTKDTANMERIKKELADSIATPSVRIPTLQPYPDPDHGLAYNLQFGDTEYTASRFAEAEVAGGTRMVLERMDIEENTIAIAKLDAMHVEIREVLANLGEWIEWTQFSYARPTFGTSEDIEAKQRAAELAEHSARALPAPETSPNIEDASFRPASQDDEPEDSFDEGEEAEAARQE